MSKPVKRRCPQCGRLRLFRADCKTCGCPRPSKATAPDPLAGRYFRSAQDERGECAIGRIVSHLSSSLYLVAYNDLYPEGEERWRERIVPVSTMRDWELSDKRTFDIWLVLRGMEAEESESVAQG
jgi:hypothetical protein